MKSMRFICRFIIVVWTLGRYGALYFLDPFKGRNTGLRFLIFLVHILAPTKRDWAKKPEGERLARALQVLGPAYIKLGQTFSTRPDLVGDEIAEQLTRLQDRLPSEPAREIIEQIEMELGGKLEDHFLHFEEKPTAAASIAQVHFAATPDGEEVAVKVLRPDIEKAMEKDLQSFFWLAGVSEKHLPKTRRLKLSQVVQTLSNSVQIEMDLRMEAAAASELRENMRGEEGYRVPEVDWGRTSKRVLTQERVKGIPLGELNKTKKKVDRKKISQTLIRVFLTQALRDGFFHADLHQGNFFIEKGNVLVPVDFGIMGRLDKAERQFLAEILYGFHKRDYQSVSDLHFEAGYVPEDQPREIFAQAMRALAEPIMDKPLQDISLGKLLQQLFATAENFSMETQPQLITLQRSMVMVEGLAFNIDQDANMWKLSEAVLERRVREIKGPSTRIGEGFRLLGEILTLLPRMLENLAEIAREVEKRLKEKGGR